MCRYSSGSELKNCAVAAADWARLRVVATRPSTCWARNVAIQAALEMIWALAIANRVSSNTRPRSEEGNQRQVFFSDSPALLRNMGHRCCQQIAGAPYCLYQSGVAALIAKTLSQATNGHIHNPVQWHGLPATGNVGYGVTIQHLIGMTEKQLEQGEVCTGKSRALPMLIDQFMGQGIQPPTIKDDVARVVGSTETRPAKKGFHPGLQFPGTKGFGEVIIGAQFQAHNPIGFVGARREHNDRHPTVFTNLSAQSETVIAGQHDIQHNQVDVDRVQLQAHLVAVLRSHDLVPYPGQMLL